jgi:hypothetical protein
MMIIWQNLVYTLPVDEISLFDESGEGRKMTSQYSVIQYLPEPLSGELVNLGVVAFDDEGSVEFRELKDWTRARNFAGVTNKGLQNAFESLRDALKNSDAVLVTVRDLVQSFNGSLRLTEPRMSMASADETAESIATIVLHERIGSHGLAKTSLIRSSLASFENSLNKAGLGDIESKVLVRRTKLVGRLDPHTMDLGLKNGKVLWAGRALAFPERMIPNEVTLTAWTMRDLQESKNGPEVSVVIRPPQDRARKDFKRATELFEASGVDVVYPKDMARKSVALVEKYREKLVSVS